MASLSRHLRWIFLWRHVHVTHPLSPIFSWHDGHVTQIKGVILNWINWSPYTKSLAHYSLQILSDIQYCAKIKPKPLTNPNTELRKSCHLWRLCQPISFVLAKALFMLTKLSPEMEAKVLQECLAFIQYIRISQTSHWIKSIFSMCRTHSY